MPPCEAPQEASLPKLAEPPPATLPSAGQRDDRTVLPLPKSLKLQGGAASRVLKDLLKKGLLEEQPTGDNAAAWREGKDGQRLTLLITDAGRQAIGVAADEQSPATPESIAPHDSKRSAGRPRKASKSKRTASASKEKKTTSPTSLRPAT